MAAIIYGEPRYTSDVDIVVTISPDEIRRFVERFPRPEFYVDPETARQATVAHEQFNIIHPFSGLKVDVYVAGDAIARGQIANARRVTTVDGLTARFSPPEELIVKKMQFYLYGEIETHLRDIVSMLRISGERIDRDRIGQLAAEHGVSAVWRKILDLIARG